eukprot:TRINITY_DN2838_c0_g1_i1.p1 TRINITY_DN2838_c0_g1~~TRINITY_DN2838_c0_g1_i1.p1  ORF type:complete len:423 (+),score=54.83 TRINITY_DN2838_c0_g1_i1:68-1336(+)
MRSSLHALRRLAVSPQPTVSPCPALASPQRRVASLCCQPGVSETMKKRVSSTDHSALNNPFCGYSSDTSAYHIGERTTMRALRKSKPEPGLWMEETEIPRYGPTDVLIKVAYTSLCGTDGHIYAWDKWAQATIPVPMTVGHEFSGTIVAVGDSVDGIDIGQRVSGEGHLTCGFCRKCRAGVRHLCKNTVGIGVNVPGCFAEYVRLPASNVFKLPKDIGLDVASILDPLGNATHTALSFDLVGEDVLVTGAGPIGIMSASIAKHVGARHVVVTDINETRLALARTLGATRTINVAKDGLQQVKSTMQSLGMTEGFDVGFEMSGHQDGLDLMVDTMNNGGRIAQLGIPSDKVVMDLNAMIFKGLILKGIYGREMFETWYKMSNMLQGGLNVLPVITHRLDAVDYEEGFATMKSGQGGKVILKWE